LVDESSGITPLGKSSADDESEGEETFSVNVEGEGNLPSEEAFEDSSQDVLDDGTETFSPIDEARGSASASSDRPSTEDDETEYFQPIEEEK